MKPHPIGIVGGAGPLAGAYLLERLLSLCGTVYGCYKDSDFPEVILISYPFSDMLGQKTDSDQIRKELSECLAKLRKNGAKILAIACNTLHVFLDDQDDLSDLIHLPRTLAQMQLPEEPLVLCTSTSANFGLHKQFFPCTYPERLTQKRVDQLIDQVLRGVDKSPIIDALTELIKTQSAKTVILGCTELSLFSNHLSIPDKLIIDPLEVMASKILDKSFS